MDLVAGVRKEGSRGGRDSFKWSDVQQSQHRENYLGHSLMAPVGRWQNGRDLQWYAKAEDKDAEKARTEREEELRRVKEAEEEAMARALGLPVPPRSTNANLTPLGSKDVQRAIQETTGGDAEDGGKGIGFGSYGGRASGARLGPEADKLEGVGLDERPSRRDRRDRSRSPERRRDRSRDRNRERERRHHRHHHQIETIVGSQNPVNGAKKEDVLMLMTSIAGQGGITPQIIVDLIDGVAEIEVTAVDIDTTLPYG
ncbi:kinase phosphorylation protein-domain-containing protein [Paecilomyces variotii]|uniref:Kinase phosphorylation protein-domain-containing protein n=1 Tax=Byssochlamys spectabilis TaxID=264951 RepID=A0A443HMC3_BYSSP|nr:kinase phosphorylation protein-domain-containing protein [Paecilomyces variotii]RWQ92956.1 kinase phosphorylation protein-domain-containing protein [Paecilomyces variotii]